MTALRSLWNGTLRLEELRVPVALAATRGSSDVTLRTLHRACAHPLVQQPQCPIHGPVPDDEVVSGWEAAPGEFVFVEKDELERALPASTDRIVDVVQVVPASALDPTLVQSSYWLMPQDGEYARRGYAIVSSALGAKDAALVVRFAYRGDKVGVIRHVRGALLLQTLAAVGDLHPVAPIVEELGDVIVSDAEFRLARQLVNARLRPLDESVLVNRRRDALRALVDAKVANEEIVRSAPAPVDGTASAAVVPVDLEQALRRSLAALKKPAAKKRATSRRRAA